MATEMRFPVTIDDSQAAKELNKLESKIGKLKDSMAKTESSRTPIVEQLKEAQDAASEALNSVEALKASLAASENRASMAPFVENVFKAEKALTPIISRVEHLKEEIEATDDAAKKADLTKQLENEEAEMKAAADTVKNLRAELKQKEISAGLTPESDIGTYLLEEQKQARIKAELAEQEKIMHAKEEEAQKLEKADTEILKKLKDQTAELEKAQTRAGELTKQITDASKGKDIKTAFAAASASLQSGAKNILKWGAGITGLVALARRLRTYIIEAVKSFAENDPETKANIDSLRASLAGLKASWGAAFAPVLNAVVPVLQTLISWLTAAANAVAQFFAVLSGKGTFKKAIANTGKLSSNLGGAADNAKEAKKQLMGIDTLNVMNDTNTGSGGGGGGGGNDALDWVEEAVNMDSFAGKLALSFKDVFLDWNDLTGEQIAEKIIAGLAGLAGGVMGFMIGGVPGAIVGTLAGLAIGLVADSLIFDHDGKLSANEIFKSLLLLLMGVTGGLIGFSLGGVAGAAIGATVGVALALAVRDVGVETMGTWSSMNLLEKILVFLGGLAGGAIGFAIGGPLGAVLGATIGIGLMLVAKNVDLSDVGAKLKEAGDKILEKLKEIETGISAWFDNVIEKMNSFFNNAIKTLSEKGTLITGVFILLYGSVQTIFNAIAGVIKTVLAIIRAVLITFAQVVRGLATGDWASSLEAIKSAWLTVWNSIAQTGANIINGIIGTVEAFVNNVIVMFNRLVSAVSSVMQFFGGGGISWRAGTVSIPRLAKGGIVDTATMFVAGEAGKEAVVPLERNTQWVTMVADGLIDRMTDKFAGLNMRMPAVAGGFVVPPNAFSSSGYGGISPELESKIDALLDRLNGNNRPIEVRTTVELDKRKVGESIYTYTEERNRGRGK